MAYVALPSQNRAGGNGCLGQTAPHVLALFGGKVSEQGDGRKIWVVDGNVMKMGKMRVREMWVREMRVRKVKVQEMVHLDSNPSISEFAENILRSPQPRDCRPDDNPPKDFLDLVVWKRASIVERRTVVAGRCGGPLGYNACPSPTLRWSPRAARGRYGRCGVNKPAGGRIAAGFVRPRPDPLS